VAETLEPNDSFGTAKPAPVGVPLFANVLPLGDQDWYLVEASSQGTFVVTVDEVDENLDIAFRLWDPEAVPGNWAAPARKGGVTEAEFAVPASGRYRLEVADSYNDARSARPYRLTIDFR
jgi:ABC-type proline/glycine betaine transport system substrate-binding protein